MSYDPLRYWQDSDDPNWSDEKEALFLRELSLWNLQRALRPRDKWDVDVHPESFRGQVLALYDAQQAVEAQLRSSLLGRVLLWLAHVYARVRSKTERVT